MDGLKLLNEQCISEAKVLNEETTTGEKRMYLSGPFLQACDKNRNGRIYPKEIIEREVNKFQALIESREALGELSHPESIEINPDRAAILITSLKMDGNVAIGKAKVLSTPCGKIVESLLNDGVRLGVSSRGTGSLQENNFVGDDFALATIDCVYMPSAQVAYTDAIYESVQHVSKWVLNEATGLYVERFEKIDQAQQRFNKEVDNHGSRVIVDAFKEFFKTL